MAILEKSPEVNVSWSRHFYGRGKSVRSSKRQLQLFS